MHTVIFSTLIGGSGDDRGFDIALDSSGFIYIYGSTSSTDFPVTTDAFDTTYGGGEDLFVVKMDPTGQSLNYSTYIGGSGGEWRNLFYVTSEGRVYLSGKTTSIDIPTTENAFDSSLGGTDGFFCILNEAGNSLDYCTYFGGSGEDDIDYFFPLENDEVIFSGYTYSSNLPISDDAYQSVYGGNGDMYIVKLNISSKTLVYGSYYGGSSLDAKNSQICRNEFGEYFVVSTSGSSDFPITQDAVQKTVIGGQDLVLMKFSQNLTEIKYSSFLGGSNDDFICNIKCIGLNKITIAGYSLSSDFQSDKIVSRLPTGVYFGFTIDFDFLKNKTENYNYYASSDRVIAKDFVYSSNNLYVFGNERESNMSLSGIRCNNTNQGDVDVFLIKFSNMGMNLYTPEWITENQTIDVDNLILNWTDVNWAEEYNIYINNIFYSNSVVSEKEVIFPGNGKYEVFLTASNSTGESSLSLPLSIVVSIPPPPRPEEPLWITENQTLTADRILLQWHEQQFVDSYQLFINGTFEVEIENESFEYVFKNNGRYNFQLKAFNSSGYSAFSEVLSIYVDCPSLLIPPHIELISPADNEIFENTTEIPLIYILTGDVSGATVSYNLSSTTNWNSLHGNTTLKFEEGGIYTIQLLLELSNHTVIYSETHLFTVILPTTNSLIFELNSPADNEIFEDITEIPLIYTLTGDVSGATVFYNLSSTNQWISLTGNTTISIEEEGVYSIQLMLILSNGTQILTETHSFTVFIHSDNNFDNIPGYIDIIWLLLGTYTVIFLSIYQKYRKSKNF
ncbi:MAG: SBBP repeat-containing protein [Candidatus Lokiarchaeota archaeon]|nr:SBBP repeat-containing protein [Candidatus Harpocratesius repetitus]